MAPIYTSGQRWLEFYLQSHGIDKQSFLRLITCQVCGIAENGYSFHVKTLLLARTKVLCQSSSSILLL
jgi:hypothetical protein